MDEYKYHLECASCETIQDLVVYDVDELPCYCSMCGEDVYEEWVLMDAEE